MKTKNFTYSRFKILLVLLLFFAVFIHAGCSLQSSNTATTSPQDTTSPIFTDPVEKLAETALANFTQQLINEAVLLEPDLEMPGTQIHMGFWSKSANRGNLITLLDSINSSSSSQIQPENLAIWDEGVSTITSFQYPSYIIMNREYWYERANATGNNIIVNGVNYHNPYPVTFQQADDIWGQYSQRYADMATHFRQTTGNKVKVWCFVLGAYANRIFYVYELPELRILEQAGTVTVYFAKTSNADWRNPSDWTEATNNAPEPLPASKEIVTDLFDR